MKRCVLNVGGGSKEIPIPARYDGWDHVLLDVDDVLYESNAGPITPNDVIYGWGQQIAASGNDFYAHKNCFTPTSFTKALAKAGFLWAYVGRGPYELRAFAFKREPTPEQRDLFQLPLPRGKT